MDPFRSVFFRSPRRMGFDSRRTLDSGEFDCVIWLADAFCLLLMFLLFLGSFLWEDIEKVKFLFSRKIGEKMSLMWWGFGESGVNWEAEVGDVVRVGKPFLIWAFLAWRLLLRILLCANLSIGEFGLYVHVRDSIAILLYFFIYWKLMIFSWTWFKLHLNELCILLS